MSEELERLARAARLYAIEVDRCNAGAEAGAPDDWLHDAERDVQDALDQLQDAAKAWAND